MSRTRLHLRLALCCAALLLPLCAARAQVAPADSSARPAPAPADTVRPAPADTVRPAADSVRAAHRPAPPTRLAPGVSPGFRRAEPGDTTGGLPTLTRALTATDLLADLPGTFVYRFESPGWPDAWSPYGLAPHAAGVVLNGLPFDNVVTGRPRLELLPLAFVEPLRMAGPRLGAPVAIAATLRMPATLRPYTEVRFNRGAPGLQDVAVTHTQTHSQRLFGQPGQLHFTGAYAGRAAQGEYPGSSLRRQRRVLGRVQYEQAGYTIELLALHMREQVGAHGGVLPRASGGYQSIFQRFGASTRNAGNRRRTIRTDLAVTLRTRLFGAARAPLQAMLYRTVETARFTQSARVDFARGTRTGFQVVQGLGRAELRLEGYTAGSLYGNALPDSLGLHDRRLHASVRDTLGGRGPLRLVLEGGVHHDGAGLLPAGMADARLRAGGLTLYAAATHAGQPRPFIARYGFGPFVQGAPTLPRPRLTLVRVGAATGGGTFGVRVEGYASRQQDAFDFFGTTGNDTVAVLAPGGSVNRVGVSLEATWRADARSGLYATLQPQAGHTAGAGGSELARRIADALPDAWGSARLGARFRLFKGDLDVDLYARARAWTAMGGRALNPATGLLVIPAPGTRRVDAGSTLDVGIDAWVRTARVFVTFDNALSGTTLVPGNLMVPGYPLGERAFRFGVWWPISG